MDASQTQYSDCVVHLSQRCLGNDFVEAKCCLQKSGRGPEVEQYGAKIVSQMQTNHSKLKQNGFTNKCNMRSERCHTPGWDPFHRRSPLVCRPVVVPCYGAQLWLPPTPQVAVSRMLFSVFVQKLRFSIVGALVSPRYPTKKWKAGTSTKSNCAHPR